MFLIFHNFFIVGVVFLLIWIVTLVQMCIPEEKFIIYETINATGLPLSEDEIGLLHLYQSDVPILGQETEIQGLYPGQLGIVLEMSSIEYIFFTNKQWLMSMKVSCRQKQKLKVLNRWMI